VSIVADKIQGSRHCKNYLVDGLKSEKLNGGWGESGIKLVQDKSLTSRTVAENPGPMVTLAFLL